MIEYLKHNYSDFKASVIADTLGINIHNIYHKAELLGLKKSARFFGSDKSGRLSGFRGINTRFKKGNIPWNKGKHIGSKGRSKKTQFKKGHLPHNTKKDLCITTRACGHKFIRIALAKWIELGRYNWEEVNGAIPPGLNLVFKNGHPQNCEINNLELITNEELMKRNSIHNLPEELKSAIHTLGVLNRKIHDYEKRD